MKKLISTPIDTIILIIISFQLLTMQNKLYAMLELSAMRSFSPLMHAIKNRNPEETQRLINLNADINQKTEHGLSVLAFAASIGHEETINLLLNAKADIRNAGIDSISPMMLAIANNHPKIAKILYDIDHEQNNN